MKKVWRVVEIESERGWGQKVFDTSYFKDKAKAQKYSDSVNAQNVAPTAPDWYVMAIQPEEVDVPEKKDFRD